MTRVILQFVLLLSLSPVFAQRADSLFVLQGEDGWLIAHKIKLNETIFSIARNYHVPPAMLSDANNMSIQQALKPGSKIYVPVGAYNLKNETGMRTGEMRALYYKLNAGESLRKIARNSNVNQRRLMDWNNIEDKNLYEGQSILVGWLLYDATGNTIPVSNDHTVPKPATMPQTTQPKTPISKPLPVKKDTVFVINGIKYPATPVTDSLEEEKSEVELLYDAQTVNETRITKEKGPAAFFKSNNSSPSFYYAFHNSAPKGFIIKVKNTNNGKSVFVKVLGKIPETGLYHNCIIGISNKARAALGVRDEKAWCELTYGK